MKTLAKDGKEELYLENRELIPFFKYEGRKKKVKNSLAPGNASIK